MQHLVIFDIDGTLTHTNAIDGICYEAALGEEFGIRGIETDWSSYTHTTDSCILDQVFHKAFDRRIQPQEVKRFQHRFLDLLRLAHSKNPDDFREISGAKAALLKLQADPRCLVALGSGGWKLSALFKLQCIGIEADHIPAAFADDALSREEIVNTAIRRAITMKAGTGFQSVTYVGDGLWDAKTCRNLGIPFVGIACGPKAERLRDEGASSVLADFRDASALEQALAKARIPGQAPDPACSQRKVKP